MPPFSRLSKLLSLIVVAVLLAQCGGPTPAPTATVPPPSPTPLPPVQPVVADHFPGQGDELTLDGSIDVYFDQPMDKPSVEAAFSINPKVDGKFTWLDNATVRFTPNAQLERATRYAVTIGISAKSAAGIILKDPYTFNADTVGFLEVTQVLPAPDTQQVDVKAAITVMFNRPVVPLGLTTDTANAANLPNPLQLTPPVAGKGEWLNTSIFVFRPDKALAGSTNYTATIKNGLTSTAGSLLQKDYSWSFSTLPPSVSQVDPVLGSLDVPLESPVTITFNQEMDQASTQAAFSLTADGAAVSGKFSWNDEGNELTYTPDQKLAYAKSYEVRVGVGAKSIDGQTPLDADFDSTFNTVLLPGIQSTDPSNGASVSPFNGLRIVFASPMDDTTLKPNVTISPDAPITYDYYSDSDHSYYLSFDLKPSSTYTVTLGANMADPYGQTIGQPVTIQFNTEDYDPIFQFNTRGDVGVYRADTPTSLYVTYRNLSHMHFQLYNMSLDDFAGWTGPDTYNFQQAYQPGTPIRDFTLDVENFPNENAYVKVPLTDDNTPLTPGIYFLKGDVPGTNLAATHVLVVSKYNVTLQDTFGSAQVWVTDQVTGQPVNGLPIVIRDKDFETLGQGTTDAQGLFKTNLDTTLPDLWSNVYALSPEGPDFAVTTSNWSSGIDAYDFNLNANYYPPTGSVYMYTDRPVYRPGQDVSFKGVVRNENDARFSLPDTKQLGLTITNDQGDKVYEGNVTLDEFGTFSGVFKLSDSASTGYYSINVETDANGNFQSYLGFLVAEYHKPEFLVNVTTDKPEVVQGSTINATIESTFYFGGPVSNADVSWTLLTANSYFQYDGPGYYDFSDFDYTSGEGAPSYGAFGEVIASGTGKTDAQGHLRLQVPADIGKRTSSQIFTLEATITDVSGQEVSGRTEVKVHQGDFYLGIGPDEFVAQTGQDSKFNVIALDWHGQPSPNRQVDVAFFQHDWKCAQEKDQFDNAVWTCTAKDTQVATDSVTTDKDGKAVTSFKPDQGGTYKVVVSSKDSTGHTITSASYIWVISDDFISWRQDNNNRLNLVPDRKEYKPGDTASILIPSPFQGATKALVTVERGGFYKTEVLDLTSNSTLYKLPITPDYAPDVYVSVIIVKGVDATSPSPAFRMGLAHLKVSNLQEALTVTLTPDKTKVGPRDTVTYKVKATDYAGKPVQAQFSLGLADLAALSLAAPNSGPILDAF